MMSLLGDWLRTWAVSTAGPPPLPASEPRVRVLMVCMGNICRSPTAEAVLRARLHGVGLGNTVDVDSAGTHGMHAGTRPDPRAVLHAAGRGYDMAALRARTVASDDFNRFDQIWAMDAANLKWLERARPTGSRAQLGLLMDNGSRHLGVIDVPDPYYGHAAGFEHVLDLIEDACDGLVASLQRAVRDPRAT